LPKAPDLHVHMHKPVSNLSALAHGFH
jgi:hypothetical protein